MSDLRGSLLNDEGNDEDTKVCIDYKGVNTTYVDHPNSYLFSGIMFTIKAKTTLRVSTFALDTRYDQVFGGGVDYGVQVFTLPRAYTAEDTEDISAWTRIANSESLPTPIGGVVIPEQAMDTQTIEANRQQSFYIHVNGQYIDSRANGLDKTGERDQAFDDFDVFVGRGLKGKFKVDNTVDPKFSGIVFYEKDQPCQTEPLVSKPSTTTIQYEFRLDNDGADPTAVVAKVNRAVDDFLDLLVTVADPLTDAMQNHGLVKIANATSTSVVKDLRDCSEYFANCFAVTTDVKYEHSDSMLQEEVFFEFYQYATEMALRVQSALEIRQMSYNGRRGSSGVFRITLQGVPSRQQLSEDQKQYFESALLDYLTKNLITSEEVYTVEVHDQLLLDARVLEVTGEVRGVQYTAGQDHFAKAVQTTLRNGEQDFLKALYFDLVVPPSPLVDDEVGFFRDITGVAPNVEYRPPLPLSLPTLSPIPAPEGGVDKTDDDGAADRWKERAKEGGVDFWLPVGIIVGMAFVAFFILWLLCRLRNSWKMRYRPSNASRECAPSKRHGRKKASLASQEEGRDTMDLAERRIPVQTRKEPKKESSTRTKTSHVAEDLIQSVSTAKFQRQKNRRQRALSSDSGDSSDCGRPSAPSRNISGASQLSRFRPPERKVSGMSDFDVRSVTSDAPPRSDQGDSQTQESVLSRPSSGHDSLRRFPSGSSDEYTPSPTPRQSSPPRRFNTTASLSRSYSQHRRTPPSNVSMPSPRHESQPVGATSLLAPPMRQNSPGRRTQSMHPRLVPPSPGPGHPHSMHLRTMSQSPGPRQHHSMHHRTSPRQHHSMHHRTMPQSPGPRQHHSMHHRVMSQSPGPRRHRSMHQRRVPPSPGTSAYSQVSLHHTGVPHQSPAKSRSSHQLQGMPLSARPVRSRSVSPPKMSTGRSRNMQATQWTKSPGDLHEVGYHIPRNLSSESMKPNQTQSVHDRPILSGYSNRISTESQHSRSLHSRPGSGHDSPHRPSRQPSFGVHP